MTEETMLVDEVAELLEDRGGQYGPPSDHHARTAAALNAIKGWALTPRDVSEFFEVDKLVRRQTSPGKRDSYLDSVGYAAISWGHALRETPPERGCSGNHERCTARDCSGNCDVSSGTKRGG